MTPSTNPTKDHTKAALIGTGIFFGLMIVGLAVKPSSTPAPVETHHCFSIGGTATYYSAGNNASGSPVLIPC